MTALNSIVQDSQSDVRIEATNAIAVISHRLLAEPDEDLEKRIQKIILQLMVDPASHVTIALVKSLIHVVIDSSTSYREDFFLPQATMLVNNLTPKESNTELLEALLDFYDALLRYIFLSVHRNDTIRLPMAIF